MKKKPLNLCSPSTKCTTIGAVGKILSLENMVVTVKNAVALKLVISPSKKVGAPLINGKRNMALTEYENTLIDHIHNLEAQIDELNGENARLHKENKSYKMWMDRMTARVKEM